MSGNGLPRSYQMTDTIDTASCKGLPVGNPNFKEIIERNFYYVDKTVYIRKIFKRTLPRYF